MRRRGLTGVTEAMEPASSPCPGPEAAVDEQDRFVMILLFLDH